MSAAESSARDLLEIEPSSPVDLDAADRFPAVGLHGAGSRIPLILVHTWAGEVRHLQQLALRLAEDQPLLAISPPRGEWPRDYPRTVEAWAEFCLPTLRRVRPRGPYLLGGWSFGGVVALAVAERLAAQGEEIRRVVLLDTELPKKHPRSRRGLVRQSLHYLDETLGMPPGQRLAYARMRLARLGRRASRRVEALAAPLRRAPTPSPGAEKPPLQRAIWTAYLRFEPVATRLPVTLFWTRESHARVHDLALGWGPYLEGRFECRGVPGGHLTLFDPPHVEELGPALCATLEAAQR